VELPPFEIPATTLAREVAWIWSDPGPFARSLGVTHSRAVQPGRWAPPPPGARGRRAPGSGRREEAGRPGEKEGLREPRREGGSGRKAAGRTPEGGRDEEEEAGRGLLAEDLLGEEGAGRGGGGGEGGRRPRRRRAEAGGGGGGGGPSGCGTRTPPGGCQMQGTFDRCEVCRAQGRELPPLGFSEAAFRVGTDRRLEAAGGFKPPVFWRLQFGVFGGFNFL